MRIAIISMCAVAFLAPWAQGGTVTFDPPEAYAMPGDVVPFELTLTPTEHPLIDSISVALRAEGPLVADNFDFDEGLADACAFPPFTSPLDDGVFAGAFILDPVPSVVLGTLRVTVPVEAQPGDYLVVSIDDDFLPDPIPEPFVGQAVIHVVPEPATLVLLGVCVLFRRRPCQQRRK